ncbi:MAG TPA: hypothetical protein PKA03_13905 [Tabrizicola sp.]|nr:hypothetical protein [Tabrizicola sp.]
MPVKTLARLAALALTTLPANAEVSPGETPVDMNTAILLFQSTCLDHLPVFSGSAEALKGYTPNPETGTLYHPDLNLSFSIKTGKAKGICSMVFASDDVPGVLGIALTSAAAAVGGGEISVDPDMQNMMADLGDKGLMRFRVIGDQGGDVYFHAAVANGVPNP